MVWLGTFGGAGPISQTGQTPISTVALAGATWKLYKGPNGGTTVFSFVATNNIQNFNGDLKLFIEHLVQREGVPASSVITALQAGTEPFLGSNAVFTSSVCSIRVV
ncbi:hypothetical protein E4U53_004684 [Claviceps sorghi]|nr:hypothetical protein E4U53_004684 [Claviceps sorghi]